MTKARKKQMEHGMLVPPNIEVNSRSGRGGASLSPTGGEGWGEGVWFISPHPVMLGFRIAHRALVAWVDIAQVIPATAGPLRHGVGLALRSVWQIDPGSGARER